MGSARSSVEPSRSGIAVWRVVAPAWLAVLAIVLSARPSAARPAPFLLPEVERFRLPNGLDVVLERSGSADGRTRDAQRARGRRLPSSGE